MTTRVTDKKVKCGFPRCSNFVFFEEDDSTLCLPSNSEWAYLETSVKGVFRPYCPTHVKLYELPGATSSVSHGTE